MDDADFISSGWSDFYGLLVLEKGPLDLQSDSRGGSFTVFHVVLAFVLMHRPASRVSPSTIFNNRKHL